MVRKKRTDEMREPNIFGIGGIFNSLTRLLNQVESMSEKGQLGEVPFSAPGSKEGRIRYGYSVRFLGGEPRGPGVPKLRRKIETPAIETLAKEREYLVDVFDRKNEIIVVVDIPGLREKDIKLDVKGKELAISVETKDYRYHKSIPLPVSVRKRIKSLRYKNGILEICLKKQVKKSP